MFYTCFKGERRELFSIDTDQTQIPRKILEPNNVKPFTRANFIKSNITF